MNAIPAPVWTPTNDDYHAALGHWSSSRLKVFRDSPQLAFRRFVAGTVAPTPPSPAMIVGAIANMMLLEPEQLESGLYVVDVKSRNSKAYRDAVAAYPDRLVVTYPMRDEAAAIYEAIHEGTSKAAKFANAIFEAEGYNEYAHRWKSPQGVPCQLKVDRLLQVSGRPTMVELKSSNEVSRRGFGRKAADFDYHCQAALNLAGLTELLGEEPDLLFVVVRNEEPHEVSTFRCPPAFLEEGQMQVNEDLEKLAPLLDDETGELWISPEEAMVDDQIPEFEPPYWAFKNRDNQTY